MNNYRNKVLCPSATSDYLGININCHAAYLNESNMKLKRNERESLFHELVSTLNVIELKVRMYRYDIKTRCNENLGIK